MATNTGKGFRIGSVRERSQIYNPVTEQYVERDTGSGRFTRVKEDGTPFKGVAQEPDGRKNE
jgi:hypothetical protein